EWSSTATWACCQPALGLRRLPPSTCLPICQNRPSFLASKCTSSPGAAYSYRFAGGRGARSARDTPYRQSTRQIVDGGHPSTADRLRGPTRSGAATQGSAPPPPPTTDAGSASRSAVDPATPPTP